MSLVTESGQLPIKEALQHASEMMKVVGEKGTSQEYAQAYSQLIEKQTKELLEKKDWIGVLNFTVSLMDRIEKAHNKNVSMESENYRKKNSIRDLSARLEHLRNDKQLLSTAEQKLADGGNTLSVELYGDTLFFGMIEAAKEKAEVELKNAILKKLRQASEKNRQKTESPIQEITVSPKELIFLKKAITEATKEVGIDIQNSSSSLDEKRLKYESDHNQQQSLDQELADLNEILETAIAILDKREEEKGAPLYPEAFQTTEEQHLAYTQRIRWRREKINETGYVNVRSGNEISRKWAIYANINGQYLLLNKKHEWDDVDSIDIIINRIPEETYAVYTEGMMMTDGDISLQAILNNGTIQHPVHEVRDEHEKKMKTQKQEIKRQIR